MSYIYIYIYIFKNKGENFSFYVLINNDYLFSIFTVFISEETKDKFHTQIIKKYLI
jgi:hypothetical protein